MKLNIFKKKKNKKKQDSHKIAQENIKAFDIIMKLENGKTYHEFLKEATKGMYLFEAKEFKRKLDKELTIIARRIAHDMAR